MLVTVFSASSQVVYNKWKLKKGIWDSFYILENKFTITADKTVKYIHYIYCGVNEVGDTVDSQISVLNPQPTKIIHRRVCSTGPYEPGKSYKRVLEPAFIYKTKIKLVPIFLKVDYMDGTADSTAITSENIGKYFPTINLK